MTAPTSDFLCQIGIETKQNHKNRTLYWQVSADEAPIDFRILMTRSNLKPSLRYHPLSREDGLIGAKDLEGET